MFHLITAGTSDTTREFRFGLLFSGDEDDDHGGVCFKQDGFKLVFAAA